ncbi:MAG: hypothetical protein P8M80_10930, partial [Pirellulaceae bacterium]|nr:hypothetical protein [Pirellulaceae bacterium]
ERWSKDFVTISGEIVTEVQSSLLSPREGRHRPPSSKIDRLGFREKVAPGSPSAPARIEESPFGYKRNWCRVP